jgi:predicted MFS family arabinose efflux permease
MSLAPAALRTYAFAAGVSVANFYYVQPLLVDIGRSFGLDEAVMGLVPTLTQVGLGFGVLLLLPLGDVIDNRRLVSGAIALQAVALLVMATASNLILFFAASMVMGFTGITSYLLAPYVAHLVPSAERGRIIGLIARGAIIGILLARTVSGFIGYYIGWRAVYLFAAIAMLALLWLLRRYMAPLPRPTTAPYAHLLLSLGKLVRNEPAVRRTVFTQALNFGSFNTLWLGLSLYLESPAFGLHSDSVGMFGLLGAAAAVAAPLAGRLVDRKGPQVTLRFALALTVAAWLFMVFAQGIIGVVVGIILIDLGASATDVSNRTILFRLHPDIRTRLMAVYSIGMFFSAGILSLLTTILWAHAGWLGVCLLGLGVTSLAFLANLQGASAPQGPYGE